MVPNSNEVEMGMNTAIHNTRVFTHITTGLIKSRANIFKVLRANVDINILQLYQKSGLGVVLDAVHLGNRLDKSSLLISSCVCFKEDGERGQMMREWEGYKKGRGDPKSN